MQPHPPPKRKGVEKYHPSQKGLKNIEDEKLSKL